MFCREARLLNLQAEAQFRRELNRLTPNRDVDEPEDGTPRILAIADHV
jgi:hypothetical protein